MTNLQIGCAGWVYDDWKGSFYPKSISSQDQLMFYSNYFNVVEINSTFYNPPSLSTVKRWRRETPDGFKFIVKIWREITHVKGQKKRSNYEEKVTYFFTHLKPLEDKITCYLLQFPPSFSPSIENKEYLKQILHLAAKLTDNRIFIEFRDNEWFNDNLLVEYSSKQFSYVTVYLDEIIPFYYENQDAYYIRLIGDRQITKFNAVQREMQDSWSDMLFFIKKYLQNEKITDIFVIFNNHYTGFAPADCNNLKKELNIKYKSFNQQTHLTDFF